MRRHPRLGQVVLATVAVLSSGALRAQEGSAPVPAPATAPSPANPAQGPAPASASQPAVEGAMATVLAESSKARCWPTANSPTYEDTLAKDTVVRVGRAEGGFREVLLPIGPLGYVHRNFTGEMQDGQLPTKGKGVAFRYRPRSGEAPVTSMAEGTKLFVVGQKDDWWTVRLPGVSAWVPEADVQVFPQPPATMQKANAEFDKVQRGQVAAYLEGIKQAEAARQLADEKRKAVAVLQDQFTAELQKSPRDQQLDPIAAATDAMLTKVGDDAELQASLKELQKRIGAQKWVVEAMAVRDAEPVPSKDVAKLPPGQVADPLDRFQAVGFLRWEKGLAGPGNFVVEKGGQRLYFVSCNSGRYDLGLFLDCEVGIVGPSRRPTSNSLRVLDAERIEVLAPRP
jgi:hypothetical protein